METRVTPRASRAVRGFVCLVLATTASAAFAAGPPQRIIVKYRTALTTNELSTNAARAMVDMTSRHGVTMRTARRMHNGANVMTLDREMPEQEYMQLVKEIATS